MSHLPDPSTVASQASSSHPVESTIVSPSSTSSRRSFLGRGVAAAAVPAAILAASNVADASYPTYGPYPSYYKGSTKVKFQEVQVDEADHVNFLKGTILSLGGTPRPTPTFTGIYNLSPTQFLTLSQTFENEGVGAYLGALPYLQNPQLVVGAAQIALVEAYHAGFVNTLANIPLVTSMSGYLADPHPLSQVLVAIAPFVTSLNDDGQFPPIYNSIPSASNDIAILNFALLLEMLEASFYYANVPNLFPG